MAGKGLAWSSDTTYQTLALKKYTLKTWTQDGLLVQPPNPQPLVRKARPLLVETPLLIGEAGLEKRRPGVYNLFGKAFIHNGVAFSRPRLNKKRLPRTTMQSLIPWRHGILHAPDPFERRI